MVVSILLSFILRSKQEVGHTSTSAEVTEYNRRLTPNFRPSFVLFQLSIWAVVIFWPLYMVAMATWNNHIAVLICKSTQIITSEQPFTLDTIGNEKCYRPHDCQEIYLHIRFDIYFPFADNILLSQIYSSDSNTIFAHHQNS